MASDHVCACRNCDPTLAPTGPRMGEGHLAVRFGDHSPRISVRLDGVDVSMEGYEAVAGDPGQVWLHRQDGAGKMHFCQRCLRPGAGPCAYQAVGRVEITVSG